MGQLANGRLVFVTVDGRRPGWSVGVTNFELAQILVRLGAVTGTALDSGGSSTMAFNGKLLNRPSDPVGVRAVGDALTLFYYGVIVPKAPKPIWTSARKKLVQSRPRRLWSDSARSLALRSWRCFEIRP